MAKRLGVFAALCCVFALCFTLVGCGGGVDKGNFTGDWKLVYGSDENLDADSIELMESLGISGKLVLNEDGTGLMDMFGDEKSVKWEASSNEEGKVTLDNAEATFKLENEELTIVDYTGSTMKFKRP